MVETSLTGPTSNAPEVVAGAKAAALAVNQVGGVVDPAGGANRPIEIVVCDDRNDPNEGTNCGNEAVSQGVLAMVGNYSLVGTNYFPIVEQAGIPVIGELAVSQPELTSPMSFPFSNPVAGSFALIDVIKAAGATGLHTVLVDTPASTAFVPLIQATGTAAGLEDKGTTLIPPTATDYASYAAKAASAGGGILLTLNGPLAVKFLNALVQQGVDLHTVVLATGDFLSPEQIAEFEGGIDGAYQTGSTWPAHYTDNPGVARYNDELDASGDKTDARNGVGINAWGAVHIVADLLADAPEISSAALVTALNAAGPIDFEPITPFDWSHVAAADGLLASMRTFSDSVIISRIVDGATTPIVDHFVHIGDPIDLTGS